MKTISLEQSIRKRPMI